MGRQALIGRLAAIVIAAVLLAGPGLAAGRAAAVPASVDYARAENWICRPGVDGGTCSAGLDTVSVAADGTRTTVPYVAAANPPVDCFYVYPTSSLDPAMLSDLVPDGEKRSVHDQAARFGARCRLFAPLYHQLTIAALKRAMAVSRDPEHITLDLDIPYRDILAAWRHYLAHDNHGRGVVLIGHSQGALLLTRLIAREIETGPARDRLVAAYLAGSLAIDSGSFRSTPPCRSSSQTDCFVAWSSYTSDYRGPRLFGHANGTAQPICVSPAELDGGPLRSILQEPAAPPPGPRYRLVVGQIEARCVADAHGAAFRVSVPPGAQAGAIAAALPVSRAGPTWNFHPHDIALVQGNLLDLVEAQGAAWLRRHPDAARSGR